MVAKIKRLKSLTQALAAFAVFAVQATAVPPNGTTQAVTGTIPNQTMPIGGNCWNPLFETHWAGKSDIRVLIGEPTLQYSLSLCPMYNGRFACCPTAFEEVQQRSFRRWIEHWKRKMNYVKSFQMDMEGTKVSTTYVKADNAERMLFDKALASFSVVLRTYGTCFDTILEYMAGMLCFTCDPQWRFKVHMDSQESRVEHLKIHDSSNDALWQSCKAFGNAAQRMRMRVAESALAKSIGARFEDLSMFETKVGLARYMRHHGLLTLRGKNEKVLKIEPGTHALERTLSEEDPAVGGDDAQGLIYPVRDGRQSGFRCQVFPRQPLSLSSHSRSRFEPLRALILCISILLCCG